MLGRRPPKAPPAPSNEKCRYFPALPRGHAALMMGCKASPNVPIGFTLSLSCHLKIGVRCCGLRASFGAAASQEPACFFFQETAKSQPGGKNLADQSDLLASCQLPVASC